MLVLLLAGIPTEVISLLLDLIQTAIAILSFMEYEEVFLMVNSMLVVSGTHGVVHILAGRHTLLQVPSRFKPCPLRHIEDYPSGVVFVFTTSQ